MRDIQFEIDVKKLIPRREAGKEYFVNFVVALATDQVWAKAKHEIYQVQFKLTSGASCSVAKTDARGKVEIHTSDSEIVVSAKGLNVVFGCADGLIKSCEKDGFVYLVKGATENLARGQSGMDSDKEWGFYDQWSALYPANASRKLVSIESSVLSDGRARIETLPKLNLPEKRIWSGVNLYTQSGATDRSGSTARSISIVHSYRYRAWESALWLPQDSKSWSGLAAARTKATATARSIRRWGLYSSTVTAQHFPFIPPSECGGHEETRWLKLTNPDGKSLTVESPALFHFDAKHSSVSDYLSAPHDHELVRHPETFLNLDYCQTGIGSNMGWSLIIDDQHLVKAGCYKFRFDVQIR